MTSPKSSPPESDDTSSMISGVDTWSDIVYCEMAEEDGRDIALADIEVDLELK